MDGTLGTIQLFNGFRKTLLLMRGSAETTRRCADSPNWRRKGFSSCRGRTNVGRWSKVISKSSKTESSIAYKTKCSALNEQQTPTGISTLMQTRLQPYHFRIRSQPRRRQTQTPRRRRQNPELRPSAQHGLQRQQQIQPSDWIEPSGDRAGHPE